MSGSHGKPEREEQFEAATSVYPFSAAQILALARTWSDRPIENVARCFTFSRSDLLDFLRRRPERIKNVLKRSLDNRSTPAPYVEEVGNTYLVGYFDGTRRDERTYQDAAEAVVDYGIWNHDATSAKLKLGRRCSITLGIGARRG